MLGKFVIFVALAFCFVSAISLDKLGKQEGSDEKKDNKEVLESLKEFVRIVDKYNLNVSIIGSNKKYGAGGYVKESISLTLHMPVNDEFITEATLDDAKQDKYLKKIEVLGNKERVGAKTRVIQIKNGEDKVVADHHVNPHYLIDSPNYEWLTNYKDGEVGFTVPENETSEVLYNYVLKNPGPNGVKNIQIITANVVIKELSVSKDFPADVVAEIKSVVPRLYMGINDETIGARLLVNHLDEKFGKNFQVLVGAEKFAVGNKPYAHFQVADQKVLVYILP